MGNKLERQRVPGAEFDEVTHADDTICITTETTEMNESVKQIERQRNIWNETEQGKM